MIDLVDKAKKTLKDEPSDSIKWKPGSCCKYIQVDSEWGVKIYKIPSIREYTWNIQNIAYKNKKWQKSYKTKSFNHVIIKTTVMEAPKESSIKLAPKPGKWVDIEGGYGYLTQSADTTIEAPKDDINSLRARMESIGLYGDSVDIEKFGNYGYINGNLVCVDFDALFMTMLIHGGILQKHIKTPEGKAHTDCEIDGEIKNILKWKNE